MKHIISKLAMVVALPLSAICGGVLTSCSDMLDTSSELVNFAEDNKLNAAEDSLFSVMGIIRQMQVIADRTVLLGELRSDLVVTTDRASKDIKSVAQLDFSEDNKYNQISDYYAIINSCNYFLAKADTTLEKLGKRIFEKEYAAVKTYRAWTYLQLAKVYGKVPLVVDPLLTDLEAQKEMQKTPSDMHAICDFFINDIKPFVDTELPQYGTMNGFESKKFFVPVRVLLGELCLWAGRYQESAQYFYDYLTLKNHTVPTESASSTWYPTGLDFTTGTIASSLLTYFTEARGSETISLIPMEKSEFYGVKSYLTDVFQSTENNNYYFQATASRAYRNNSMAENYCYLAATSETQRDTIYAPKENLQKELMYGDLRLYTTFREFVENQNEFSHYASDRQYLYKLPTEFVSLYRVQQVYLLFAEAICRAGYPESAFCILKYGLRNQNIERYVCEKEREAAKSLLDFSDDFFTEYNTKGVHARGCGDSECDYLYTLPQPETELASHEDTVQYQIPLVEDMIIREKALEMAFEGQRFYDLMRVALRRNDPAYLAKRVASRTGEEDATLLSRLMNTSNWYLPKK